MTDHKAEAEWLLVPLDSTHSDFDREQAIDTAQVHATLYLAEQQRIANLLTWCSVAAQVDLSGLTDEQERMIHDGLGNR